LDRIWPDRQWADLKKGANRAEQIAWNQGRVADAFTALLFIKVAESRVRRGERYPGHWIEFARTGVRATSPNTRPVAIQSELAALAGLEGKKSESVVLSKSAFGMVQGWAPQMTGLYPVTRDLAVRMAAEGIASIYAAGGQSGIARGELKAFATDAIKMGVAFDQTADESGKMMATWRTSFKMGQDDVVALADKINYLGNTGPATTKQISGIVTKIGPLGEVAGMASGQIAAMGATLAGVGVAEEVGVGVPNADTDPVPEVLGLEETEGVLLGEAPFDKLGVKEALTVLLPLTVDVGVTEAVPVALDVVVRHRQVLSVDALAYILADAVLDRSGDQSVGHVENGLDDQQREDQQAECVVAFAD
jgi:hypothetical protein